jgi:hypothetical protein
MSIADELAKLDALRKSGVLTQEEFDAEKAKLLGGVLPSTESISSQPGRAESPQGAGWRQASDGKWYAPELHPYYKQVSATIPPGGPPASAIPPVGPPASTIPPGGPPSKHGKPPYKRWWFWAGAVVIIVIIISVAAGGSKPKKAASPPTSSTAAPTTSLTSPPTTAAPTTTTAAPTTTTAPPVAQDAVFSCSGSAPDGINITYGGEGSDLSASNLPFQATVPLDTSDMYYSVTAQLQGSGSISCSTTVNWNGSPGTVAKTSSASGGYNIAMAEVCSDFEGGYQTC